jgi:hypothetical protein
MQVQDKVGAEEKGLAMSGGERVAEEAVCPLLFCEGAADATATEPDTRKGRWMMYHKAESVKTLMGWLHSNGERERILKARLKQACFQLLV